MKIVFQQRDEVSWCVHDAKSDSHLGVLGRKSSGSSEWTYIYDDRDDASHSHGFTAPNLEAAKAYVQRFIDAKALEDQAAEGRFPVKEFKSYADHQMGLIGGLAQMFDREAAFVEVLMENIAFNIAKNFEKPLQKEAMTEIVRMMYVKLEEYNARKEESERAKGSGVEGLLKALGGSLMAVMVGRASEPEEAGEVPAAPADPKKSTHLH